MSDGILVYKGPSANEQVDKKTNTNQTSCLKVKFSNNKLIWLLGFDKIIENGDKGALNPDLDTPA